MKNRLLVTTAICGLSFFAASPAFAACTFGGSTYTCTGTDTNGVNDVDGVTVNVQAGADVTPSIGGTSAIVLRDNGTINVSGAVTGNGNSGILIRDNTNIDVNSGGAVDGSNAGIEAEVNLTVTIDNGGSVNGNTGIYVNGGTADITVNGTLTSIGIALDAANSSSTLFRYGSDSTVTGIVYASTANNTDTFRIDAVTNTSFNTNLFGTQYNDFEIFHKDNTGTTTLTGTGGQDWIVNAGALSLTDAATIGDAAVSAGATLDFDDVDGTYSGDVSGAGDWDIRNGSALTLTGNNTGFTGLLDIDGSNNVAFADVGALTGGDIRVNFSTVNFGDTMTSTNDWIIGSADATFATGANDVTLSGTISGGGGAFMGKDGTGTLTLSGNNTFDGGLNINAGKVTLEHLDGAGTGTITVGAGTELELLSLNGSFDNDVTGTGDWTITSGGLSLDLNGDNSGFTGDMEIVNTTVFAGGVTSLGFGDISIDLATLELGAGDYANDISFTALGMTVETFGNLELSGDITGAAGTFTKTGGDILTLSGTNAIGGDIAITAGRLTARSVGALGTADINNDAELVLDIASGTQTLASLITGTGNFEKLGAASTLTVTNTNTMSGDVSATQGTLRVNGSFGNAANTYVANNATLGGTGTVANVDVLNGGTFAPGNSIGTINVNGTLDFASGSTYEVEYNTTTADRTNATGAVTINAGAILDLVGTNGNYAANTDYTILTGASVTGTFGTVNNNLAFLDATQNIVGGNSLVLTLTRNNTSFAEVLQDEEKDFGDALDELANDLTTAFTNLNSDEAQQAAETLSNEHHGGVSNYAVDVNTGVLTNIATRMGASFTGNLQDVAKTNTNDGTYTAAYLEPAAGGTLDQETNYWIKAIGSVGRSKSSAEDPAQKRASFGALAGVDIAYDDKGFYGFFAGYERGLVETASQNASSDIDNYHVGAYATRPVGDGWMVNAGAAFTYHRVDSVRYVVFPGFDAAPQSDTDGYSASGFVEFNKPMQGDGFVWAPFANLTIAHSQIDGYAEENGGLANLVADDTRITNPITLLGARFAKEAYINDAPVNLFASLGWQHVMGEIEQETDMRFETGTTIFSSSGAPRARNAAIIGLGFDTQFAPGMKAFAGYNGNWSNANIDHGLEAGVKIKF